MGQSTGQSRSHHIPEHWKLKWKVWAKVHGEFRCIGAVPANDEEEAWQRAREVLDARELDAKRAKATVVL